jgi:peptide/nickel transport system substrate-binding protein
VPLADAKVREALSYAIDRDQIVQKVMKGDAVPAYGPLLPFMVGYTDNKQPGLNITKAEEILEKAGWKKNDSGQREKGGDKLAFTLVVPDWPELLMTAEVVKEQLLKIGVVVEVAPQPAADLQQGALKNRDYQAILFGQASYLHSDPYSFWHSSQKGEGGLNFAQFENKEADEVLDKIRTTSLDQEKQNESYKKFTEIFFAENPSLPLYSPQYLYVQTSDIQGLDTKRINTPAGRLNNIRNWYIYTDRVWK